MLETIWLPRQRNLRQAVEKQEALIVGRTMLSLRKVRRSHLLRIAVLDELRPDRLVCEKTGWSWTITNAQVIFQGHIFAVVTVGYARTDASDDTDAAARRATDWIALQRDWGAVNRHQGRCRGHDAVSSRRGS